MVRRVRATVIPAGLMSCGWCAVRVPVIRRHTDMALKYPECGTVTHARTRVYEAPSVNPYHVFLFEVDSNRAKGKPISRVTVSTKFKEAGERLDLHIAAHTPRKNMGFHALQRGVSLPTLTKLYRYSSQAVTLAYCGIMDKDIEGVYMNHHQCIGSLHHRW